MRNPLTGRTTREKILLLCLLWLVAGVWLFSVASRARQLWGERQSLRAEAEAQQLWLERRAESEAKTAESVRRLDPARTFNANTMVSELNLIATGAGLAPEVSSQRTERTAQFVLHTARGTFRRVPLSSLIGFYAELSRRAPYLTLDQMTLTADRAAANTVNVTFVVVAVELAR